MKTFKLVFPIYFAITIFIVTGVFVGSIIFYNRYRIDNLTTKEHHFVHTFFKLYEMHKSILRINDIERNIIEYKQAPDKVLYNTVKDSISTYIKLLIESPDIPQYYKESVDKLNVAIVQRVMFVDTLVALASEKKFDKVSSLFHNERAIKERLNLADARNELSATNMNLIHQYEHEEIQLVDQLWKIFIAMTIIFSILLTIAFVSLIKHIKKVVVLNKELQLLSDVVTLSTDAIMVADTSLTIIYWNKAAEKLYGRLQHEVIGKPLSFAIGCRNTKEEIETILNIVHQNGHWTGEQLNTNANQLPLTILATISVLRDKNHKIIGYHSINIDFAVMKKEIELKSYHSVILRSIKDPIIAYDKNFTTTLLNDAAINFFGFTIADLAKKNIREVISNISVEPHKLQEARNKLDALGQWHGELKLYDKNKQIHYIMTDASAVYNEKGEKTDTVIITKDVTYLRKLEQKLREYSGRLKEKIKIQTNLTERLNEIIENSSAMVGIMDVQQKRMVYLNSSARTNLLIPDNISVNDISVYDLFNVKKEQVNDIIDQVLRTGKWQGKNELYNYRKQTVPVLQTIFLHKNNKGEPEYFSSTCVDISDLERKEDALQKLNNLVQNSSAIMAITDLKWNFIYANNAAKAKLGIKEEDDIILHSPYEFLSLEALQEIEKLQYQLLEEGKWEGEFTYTNTQGNSIPVIQVITLHKNKKDIPEYISITSIDIAEQKKLENALKKTNVDLLELNARIQHVQAEERKEIAREVHDELGQNLTLIKLELARLLIQSNLLPDEKETIQTLSQLTQNVIDTSRKIVSNLRPIMLEDIGLSPSLRWHAKTIKKSTAINIVLQFEPDNFTFDGDTNITVYRLFQESITNVIRYSKATEVIVRIVYNNSILNITITDNGIGFDPSLVDTSKHHGLTGMKERILALQGSFQIISKIGGGGTTISVTIPNVSLLPIPD